MADIPNLNSIALPLRGTTTKEGSNEKYNTQQSFSKILEHYHLINNPSDTQKLKNNTPDSTRLLSNNNARGGKSDFQENMLSIRAYRQQLIASNIANSDTPGYKAQDIEINESIGVMNRDSMALAKSSASHMSGVTLNKVNTFNLKYRVPYQSSADGNTVEMDIERQHFAENAVMYQFTLDRVGGEFKDMAELLRNLK